jgi:AraC-like DNA-binding protein
MGIELLSDRSKVFDKADPHMVSAYVKMHVGHHEISLSQPGNHAMLSHRRLADLDLCHISYGSLTRVTSTSLRDKYHLQIMLRGACLQRETNRQRMLLAGDLVVINPHDPIDLTYSKDCEKFILKIPVALLDLVCNEQHWSSPREGLRFGSQVYKLEEIQGFAQLLSLVCREVEMEDNLLPVERHYAQIIARKVLTCLATNLDFQSIDSHKPSLQRVMNHIEMNLKEEISAQALANLANMSLRSLYLLFDQQVGVTPRRYIVRRKLERIRAALLDPDYRVRNVTELAMDYGLTHLGRFSAEYKEQFAELPSQTLKRRSQA